MGYNTTVLVLNDALHEIENDPEFGKKLAAAIRKVSCYKGPIDVPVGCHANPVTVIETHHADGTAVVAIGGNYGSVLHETYGWKHHERQHQERIIKEMADLLKRKASSPVMEAHLRNLRPLENAQNE